MATNDLRQTGAEGRRQKIRLGDLLVEHKMLSEQQLHNALLEQKKHGRKLGHVLVELGYVEEDALLRFLSRQLDVPVLDLKRHRFQPEIVRHLPETHARRYRALVVSESAEGLVVGMADPTDLFAYDELARILKKPLRLVLVREAELLRAIDVAYRRTDEISSLAEELGAELSEGDYDLARLVSDEMSADAPVIKLLQSIFEDAVQVAASDIHIEPDERVLRVRQRIDGVLHEQTIEGTRVAAALVTRLKLMAALDISEKRLPQDGRFSIRVQGKTIDVRVSTMPIQHGESVVMRLLDQSSGMMDLENLEVPQPMLRRIRRTIARTFGMMLVTGPTGSGKTTTLYAALRHINRSGIKIITVEDPVEYRLERINQVQIHPKIGLDFARVLRAALRQDPDVIMIGEMRDRDTAEVGLRAAMTGHLVLSTVHTNSAIATVTRLLDLGAPGFMIASALTAVLGQRLVRKVCDSCGSEVPLDANQRAWIASHLGEEAAARFCARLGSGCAYCNHTGYRGRVAIYELLEIDDELADALRREDSAAFARTVRAKAGFRPLELYALDCAQRGVTSVEEAMRVTGVDEEDVATNAPVDRSATAEPRHG